MHQAQTPAKELTVTRLVGRKPPSVAFQNLIREWRLRFIYSLMSAKPSLLGKIDSLFRILRNFQKPFAAAAVSDVMDPNAIPKSKIFPVASLLNGESKKKSTGSPKSLRGVKSNMVATRTTPRRCSRS
jgi:hypothetical protein